MLRDIDQAEISGGGVAEGSEAEGDRCFGRREGETNIGGLGRSEAEADTVEFETRPEAVTEAVQRL